MQLGSVCIVAVEMFVLNWFLDAAIIFFTYFKGFKIWTVLFNGSQCIQFYGPEKVIQKFGFLNHGRS